MILNRLKSKKGNANAIPMMLVIITTFAFSLILFYNSISGNMYSLNVRRYRNAIEMATRTGLHNINFSLTTVENANKYASASIVVTNVPNRNGYIKITIGGVSKSIYVYSSYSLNSMASLIKSNLPSSIIHSSSLSGSRINFQYDPSGGNTISFEDTGSTGTKLIIINGKSSNVTSEELLALGLLTPGSTTTYTTAPSNLESTAVITIMDKPTSNGSIEVSLNGQGVLFSVNASGSTSDIASAICSNINSSLNSVTATCSYSGSSVAITYKTQKGQTNIIEFDGGTTGTTAKVTHDAGIASTNILHLRLDTANFTNEFYNVLFGNLGISEEDAGLYRQYIPLKAIIENDTVLISGMTDEWVSYPLAFYCTDGKYNGYYSDIYGAINTYAESSSGKLIYFTLDSQIYQVADNTKSYKLEANRRYLAGPTDSSIFTEKAIREKVTEIVEKIIENYLSLTASNSNFATINLFNKYDAETQDLLSSVDGIGFLCVIDGMPIRTLSGAKTLSMVYSLDFGASGLTRKDISNKKSALIT